MLERRRHGAEVDLHLSAEQISQRRRLAAIWHVDHVDAGHHLEQLAGHMGHRVPLPGDAMLILPGLALA